VWVYEICDKGPLDPDCPSDKALSNVGILLGDLSTCLNEGSDITFEKIADSAGNGADLICTVGDGNPSCDPNPEGQVAKCNVEDTNPLHPGDCVQMQLSIAGETVLLGVGAIQVQSKAGPDCTDGACIKGPSCEDCDNTGEGNGDECLTRTLGFWGTHPHITELFLPITVCGEDLTMTDAGTCDSVTEALCVNPGKESRRNRAYAQLVRQLAAAKLNLAATAANSGSCPTEIDDIIAACEAFCGEDQRTISNSGCIEALEEFNESVDTIPPHDSSSI